VSRVVEIGVASLPAPQGSFRPMISKSTGKPFLAPSNATGYPRYRADLRAGAMAALDGHTPMTWAVHLEVTFVLPRPAGHFLPVNTKRPVPELNPNAPVYPFGQPDLDKLCRSVLDALTGIVYLDDAQVIHLNAGKVYSDDFAFGGFTKIRVTGGDHS